MAVVATMYRNSSPHLTPKWYRYAGKALTLITRTDGLLASPYACMICAPPINPTAEIV
jgi:hypothetical protein